ncbi:MAG TPA: TlpA disulfide reductase family protein [Mariniphaga sp.]|nr:TlpA disulfide reductase family protein [Mariniphaga sp.]
MNLTRLIITGMLTGMIAVGCSKKEGRFSLTGKITHAEGQTIYLEELQVASTKPLDSVKINKKGEFIFYGETNSPAFYLLKLNPTKFITLLIDSLEEVRIEADAANFGRNYTVEGSEGSAQVKILNDHFLHTKKKLDSLQSLRNMYSGNPDYEQQNRQWGMMVDSIKDDQVEFSTRFVMEHPFSLASVLAVYQKFDDNEYIINDLHTIRVAASALNSVYPNSGHVKALYQNTLDLMKQEQSIKLRQMVLEQGENSPDIVLPTPEGNEVALSSLRGKVVLLHFWSALDKNSRIQNEALVEAYRKYKNKGFEIYQVSVDDNRIEWVDAIDQDNLSWINVGDMEGSNSALLLYNIQNVPSNYLIGPEGEILAKNLAGQNLNKTLSQVLN